MAIPIKPPINTWKEYFDDAYCNKVKTSDAPEEYWTTGDSTIKYDYNDINFNGLLNGTIADSAIATPAISADEIDVGGKSLTNVLDKMQERLAIIDDPSPEKLEKFAALKKAYEQYKILEKLCFEHGDDE